MTWLRGDSTDLAPLQAVDKAAFASIWIANNPDGDAAGLGFVSF